MKTHFIIAFLASLVIVGFLVYKILKANHLLPSPFKELKKRWRVEGKNDFPIILWRSEMKDILPAAVVLVFSIWLLSAGCRSPTGPPDPGEPPGEYVYTQPSETGDGWETASLVDTGFDVSRLVSLVNAVRSGTYDALHGLLIVQQGKLVFEEYFPGYASSGERQEGSWIEYDRDTKHECQSATKSFRSAVLGIAIDQGLIDSVDEPVLSFFPELAELNTGEKSQITLWHLLTMSSGLDWPETQLPYPDTQNPLWQLYQRPRQQWPRFILRSAHGGLSRHRLELQLRAHLPHQRDFGQDHRHQRSGLRRHPALPKDGKQFSERLSIRRLRSSS